MLEAKVKKEKKIKTANFFEMSSAEKKKIVNRAAIESTKKQVKLLKEYGYVFGNK